MLTLKLDGNVSVANGGVITAASPLLHGKDSIPPHTNAPIPKKIRNFLSIFQTLPTQKNTTLF
jgi:hypothetical protein